MNKRGREKERVRDAELSRETGDTTMATISMTTMTTTSTSTSTSTATATAMATATEPRKSYHELCRLCASYDAVRMHIFGQEGKNRQLVDKIQTCLPFKVSFLFVLAIPILSCSSWDSLSICFNLSLSFPLSPISFHLPQRPSFFPSFSISFTFLNHLLRGTS